ncbi:tyrosine-type recombinase/integrase [Candidatus Saccharibacteria bacterium]|nr:tyrosine-type recombinase/integrase [Candidatus Saccharibacteria bacterium]
MRIIKYQVDEYLEYCEKVRNMSPVTLRSKQNILERFIKITDIDDLQSLTNTSFNQWVKWLTETGVAPRSINTYNATIMAMIRYYRGLGVKVPLQTSLVSKLREGQTRRRFYTTDEVETAISYAGFETGLMIRIMYETGMRIAELTHLKISDFSGRRVQFIGKGRKPREVYVREDTLLEIQEFTRSRASGYLFATPGGDPPTVATVRKRLRRPFYAAGFDDFYPHALRHSFATSLQLKGASVEEIKEMLGHESVATTERYLHGFEGRLEELFDKYQ